MFSINLIFQEFINSAFVEDDDTRVEEIPVPTEKPRDSEPKSVANAVVTRHRDKSRELADALKQDDDPNQVSERIRGVQERVRDKLRPLLQTQTQPATSPTGQDLRLDLTGASYANDLNASQSMLSGTQRFNASDKARELAEQKLRKIKESSYRTVASGTIKRDTTRFDDDDDETEADRQADTLARSKFRKIGLAVIQVIYNRGLFKHFYYISDLKGIHVPTDDEKLDFFSKQTWEEEKPEPRPKKSDEEIQKADDDKKDQSWLIFDFTCFSLIILNINQIKRKNPSRLL